MSQVFLSHSSHDRPFVEQELIPLLRRHAIRPWYSTDDIPSAAQWERKIRDGLDSSEWFLVVLSPAAVTSTWVRTEVHWALERRSQHFVPLLLEEVDPTELHLGLIRYQYIDYRQPTDRARASLLAVFGTRLGSDLAMAVRLIVHPEDSMEGQPHRLIVADSAVLGRGAAADLLLKSSSVSRSHAALRVRETEGRKTLWLCDLGSSGGTFLNGARLEAPRVVSAGDEIMLGRTRLRVDHLEDLTGGASRLMIRSCQAADFDTIYEIINAAAEAYQGVIPPDCWHQPYMSLDALRREIEEGVRFWAVEDGGHLVAVMGLQHIHDVALIRHAYTRPSQQHCGHGSALLSHFRQRTERPILVGTWKAATWAIRFYQKHGFRLVDRDATDRLLRRYWTVPPRQIEESVVLADERGLASVEAPIASSR